MTPVKRAPAFLLRAFLALSLLPLGAQEPPKPEVIEATARGQRQGTARLFNVTVTIESYSTAEDAQSLIDAFKAGGHDGIVKTLRGMKSRGKVAITGTTSYQIAYVRSIPRKNGRTIRLITDRPIQFTGEYQGGPMLGYDLSGIELNLAPDPKLSDGSLVLAGRFRVEKNQISFGIYGAGPWNLGNIRQR